MSVQWKRLLGRIANIGLTCLLVPVLVTGALYAMEKGSSADDIVTFYGYVTTQSSFTLPEPVSSYTFGKWVDPDKEEGVITFVNQMWCKQLGADVNADVIDTRIQPRTDFAFVNTPPDNIARITEVPPLRQFISFGVEDRDVIRAAAEEQNYVSWNMGPISPDVDSRCHVTAEVIVYTKIFKLPKVLHFSGNHFNYYVERTSLP